MERHIIFITALALVIAPVAGTATGVGGQEDLVEVEQATWGTNGAVTAELPGNPSVSTADGTVKYIIGFHELPQDRASYQGHDVAAVNDAIDFFVVETDNPVLLESQARQDDRVRYIDQDERRTDVLLLTPNDALYNEPGHWGSKKVNAESAWDSTTGSTSVILANIDSGLNKDHEEFATRDGVLQGYDFVDDDTDPQDEKGGALFGCNYHGTHTAGTAGAHINNGAGIAGMSQHSIMPLKALGGGGSCGATESDLASALTYAADNGAHITSNSWRWPDPTATLLDAIDYTYGAGVLIVSAAGNNGPCTNCVEEPWIHRPSKVTIVSSTNQNDGLSDFSSQGPEVDIAAPGSDILSSTASPDSYGVYSGTSMATPHVSGTAALIKALDATLTNDQLHNQLTSTAADIGLTSDEQGSGRLDAAAATSGLGGSTNSPPTASFTFSCTDLTCDFDGSGSSDSDGSISSYDWDFGDGNTATGATVTHTYASSGTYTVTLTVTDDGGATDSSSQDVSAGTTNSPPTASFTFSCTDLTCDFDGSGSSDSDGSISSYDWDFGDGNTATGATVTHTYASGGDYTVTLTVTDDDGATDTDSQVVSVSSGSTGSTMHVHDIDHFTKGPHLYIDIWVYDSAENPVSGATVTVEVCDSGNTCASASGTTGSNGLVEFRWRQAGSGTYTSCVTGLTHDTLTWDSAADHAGSGSCETETV